MRDYMIAFDDDAGIASNENGGFDIVHTDEETAVELFRLWWHAKRAEADHLERVEARRAAMRLVESDRR